MSSNLRFRENALGPDTTRQQWLREQQKDTLASIVMHRPLLHYISIADNVSIERKRLELLNRLAFGSSNKSDNKNDSNNNR